MQVAHRSHVIDMLDGAALRRVIESERPDLVVPEIEAIATDTLVALEAEGQRVVPTARAARLTMDREGIRRLAAETLGVRTSPYRFADSAAAFRAAIDEIGMPCVVKPVMSSSGKGQSVVHKAENVGAGGKVIVEGFVEFDYEITLLTVRHRDGVSLCEPVGHRQVDGDYVESWQPQDMSRGALAESRRIAAAVTDALGGYGIFGVEFFVKGEMVHFSEVSPRPHDTGMVTLVSQNLSEFALHARAILGLPVPEIVLHGPAASAALLVDADSDQVVFANLDRALAEPGTDLRLFGKPEVRGHRRMGVGLARGESVEIARAKARSVVASVRAEP
jgi:phosphoribosylglycinamide formyltransferase 2